MPYPQNKNTIGFTINKIGFVIDKSNIKDEVGDRLRDNASAPCLGSLADAGTSRPDWQTPRGRTTGSACDADSGDAGPDAAPG